MDIGKVFKTIIEIEHGIIMSKDVLRHAQEIVTNFPEAKVKVSHAEKTGKKISVKKARKK